MVKKEEFERSDAPPEISEIGGELPPLPTLEALDKLLFELNEVAVPKKESDINSDTVAFYHLLLGLLLTVSIQAEEKAEELVRQFDDLLLDDLPQFLTDSNIFYWQLRKSGIDQNYSSNPGENNHQRIQKRYIELKLLFNYLTFELRRIIEASIISVYFKKVKSDTFSPKENIIRGVLNGLHSLEFKTEREEWAKIYLFSFSYASHFWNEASLHSIIKWCELLLQQRFHRGDPPFYIYIDTDEFPDHVPRAYYYGEWVSGFNQRLIVPYLSVLTSDQKSELWNTLLIKEDIYGNENIDHSVRGEVFKLMQHMMADGVEHLDLCGGKGDFLLWLAKQGSNAKSQLIDIAPKAVEYAQELGLKAVVGNVEEALEIEQPVDVITIIYAVQWLDERTYQLLLPLLNPGGRLIFNVYPPELEEAEKYVGLLQAQGYVHVAFQESEGSKGKHYIVHAEKPIE